MAATMTEVLCPDFDEESSDVVPDDGTFEGETESLDVAVVT